MDVEALDEVTVDRFAQRPILRHNFELCQSEVVSLADLDDNLPELHLSVDQNLLLDFVRVQADDDLDVV